jgi:hypothetical protein
MRLTRAFSLTNFSIATSALAFQVFVLYPWHHQLDTDFKHLEKRVQEQLEAGQKRNEAMNAEHLGDMKEIRTALALGQEKAGSRWRGL